MTAIDLILLLWLMGVGIILWIGVETFKRRPAYIMPLIYTEIAVIAFILMIYALIKLS